VPSVERRNELGARLRTTLKGRGLLRRGFVEGLDRSPRYAASPFSCPRRKIPSAQAIPSRKMML